MAHQSRDDDHVAPEALLEEARRLHRSGSLAEARKLYLALRSAHPTNVEALFHLAQIACQEGRFSNGVVFLNEALAGRPRWVRALNLQGSALAQLGRLQEALDCFERAIEFEPGSAEAHGSRGDVLAGLGRQTEAIEAYDRALALEPASIEIWCNRGAALHELARHDDAIASFDRALALKPDFAEVHFNRGNVLRACGRFEDALQSYTKVLAISPSNTGARAAQGMMFIALDQPHEAVASFDRALADGAGSFELHLNRGSALFKLERFDQALANFRCALDLEPDDVDALYNVGFTLGTLHRPDEALAIYETLLRIKPDHVDALLNQGGDLQQLRRDREALASYARVIALKPDHVDAHLNEALAHLALGDFQSGWPKFEWRLRKGGFQIRPFAQPVWRGQPIAGKTLFLHAEQGFGDSIQMARYIPLAAGMGARIVLEVAPALKDLMSTIEGVASVVARGDPIPALDYHYPLMSLPLAFRTEPDTIPAAVPYLVADSARAKAWLARLPSSGQLRVGVNWCGNPAFTGDRNRSMTLDHVAPLLATSGVDFVILNPRIRREDAARAATMPNVHNIAPAFRDFSDTAAVMAGLDLILTTDTAVAHLAGALGRPLWMMLSHAPDWRWALDAEKNRWYPTARLFRQPAPGDWGGMLAQVQRELTSLVASRSV